MTDSAVTAVRGMHVRVPRNHILLAKRLASRAGLSLSDYIDELIMRDVGANADSVRAEFADWKKEAELELQAAEAALAELPTK